MAMAAKRGRGFLKILEEIHNEIYANEGLSRQQAFEEIIKVLFVKTFDERQNLGHFFISRQEKAKCDQEGKCSTFERRIGDLFKYTKLEYKEVFESGEKIKLTTKSLGLVVEKLQAIDLNKLAGKGAGMVFQKFISNNQKGERGQFFTPGPVVKMCVEMIGPRKHEVILDPACGSGGFLVQAIEEVVAKTDRLRRVEYIRNKIRGIEINQSVARVAKMGIALAGGECGVIITADSLADEKELRQNLKKWPGKDKIDGWAEIILTNPPFGTKGKIRKKKQLGEFDLGYKYLHENGIWKKTRILQKGQVPEILFIERCLKFLKRDGRMAMVIPQGKLENPMFGYLREYIRNQAALAAVIDLPEGTFAPYGTSVKTSIVFLTKNKQRGKAVFFGKVTNIRKSSFQRVLENYRRFQRKKAFRDEGSFVLKNSDISDRIDYEFNRPKYQILMEGLKSKGGVELGRITNISNEAPDKKIQERKKIKYVEISNINAAYCEIGSHREVAGDRLPRRAAYIIRKGDILVAVAGNMIGTKRQAVALVGEEYDGAICSSGFRVLRNFTIDSYYLLYYIKSINFKKQIRRYRVGSLIPSVSEEDLGNILVIVPNKEKIEKISKMIRKSIGLRKRANKIWSKIEGGE